VFVESAQKKSVDLIVNGAPVTSNVATLADLLDEQGFSGVRVATALNGEFVAMRQRTTQRLQSGDRIEIVSARQGG
jgi:sulfur carrier protein